MQSTSHFEDLSNELLLDIFDYLSHRQLIISILGINQRFNQLVMCRPVDIVIYGTSCHLDPMLSCGIISLAYIRSITIIGPLCGEFIENDLCSYLKSSPSPSLVSLRALKCVKVNPMIIREIYNQIPDFNQLEHIYLDSDEQLDTNEFFLLLTGTSLRRCHIASGQFNLNSLQPSSRLQRLHLTRCNWPELIPFIAQSVVYLRVSMATWDIPIEIEQTKLKHLYLSIDNVDTSILPQFDALLRACPDLRFLSIEISHDHFFKCILFESHHVCNAIRSLPWPCLIERVCFRINRQTKTLLVSDEKKECASWIKQNVFQYACIQESHKKPYSTELILSRVIKVKSK
ncbi:unnamed protein product [Rotaria socialis]|uniref:F-box domain-containing protein n=1 Tax=Rotaria socialis TaxID=392032 RepID=A0A820SQB1_9BILA|nr:unnamed protein product [Rotaria socialis]CAF3499608.1 unnamed protein product [Rotaria socialis]CAF3508882.1 unnamed protein product [Rotaria socialis]CAF3668551.1 unnamed protein product [Rotaria socialis]CAF4439833.1 unnamed protein product [Rotaria socialis]